MKKLRLIHFLLCLVLLSQMVLTPALATAPQEGEETLPTLSSAEGQIAPEAEFGSATVLSGCRTFNAQVPLGGSDRKLETAVSAFAYERNTGTVVYFYNPDQEVQPGTFTKIVTAIVALENGDPDALVTVNSLSYKSLPTGAKTADPYLKEGEQLTLNDLLHLMILTWANDATVTIAEHIAGSQQAFVDMMNEWVKRAGCTNTHFSDCHGIGTSQMTTARDMARIVEEATKNPAFRELFGANNYTVPITNKTEKTRALKALNYLKEETYLPDVVYKGVTGGIAHYSEASGASIVCTAEKNNMSYTIVIMGCERKFKENGWSVESYGNYEEAWTLLDYVFDNYKLCRLLHEGQSMVQFDVADGENDVVAQTHSSMDAILPVNAKLDNLIMKYAMASGGLKAPIALDEKIANLQIWYRNSCIAETELYAMSSVRRSDKSGVNIRSTAIRDDSNLGDFLSFIGIVCLVILGLFVVYLVYNNMRRAIARSRRRRRRQAGKRRRSQ